MDGYQRSPTELLGSVADSDASNPAAPLSEAARPLVVRDLSVAYGRGTPALWNVDFAAPLRGMTAIIGPNGAGKSTFIKACLGLVPLLSGAIRVFGEPLARQRRLVGYVPQRNRCPSESCATGRSSRSPIAKISARRAMRSRCCDRGSP